MGLENMEREKITELCDDYAKFLKIDISQDVTSTAEIIEETLTRLEEFLSVMVMVQGECGEKQVESLIIRKQELNALGDLIDKLQAVVAVVAQCVNEMETCLVNAEIDTDANKGTLRNFLKPFFKKSEHAVSHVFGPRASKFEPPEIFSTTDFFLQQNKENI